MTLLVEITDKGAIYVDGSRITHRGTKWGVHSIIAGFKCASAESVADECLKRGFEAHVANIDMHGFGKELTS